MPFGGFLDYDRDLARSQSPNDVVVADYYYGINCPACKKSTPIIDRLNKEMRGAGIDKWAADDVYSTQSMMHDNLGKKRSPTFTASLKDGGVEATPTIIWADGLITQGLPFEDGGDIRKNETEEYMCIRAAKSYLKQTNPHMQSDDIQGIIDQVFQGRVVKTQDGRDPYKGLAEITYVK